MPPEVLKSILSYNSISEQSAKRLTIKIVCISIGRNIPFYVHISEEIMYHKPVVLPVQCKLIKKIDWEGWLKRLTKKIR